MTQTSVLHQELPKNNKTETTVCIHLVNRQIILLFYQAKLWNVWLIIALSMWGFAALLCFVSLYTEYN